MPVYSWGNTSDDFEPVLEVMQPCKDQKTCPPMPSSWQFHKVTIFWTGILSTAGNTQNTTGNLNFDCSFRKYFNQWCYYCLHAILHAFTKWWRIVHFFTFWISSFVQFSMVRVHKYSCRIEKESKFSNQIMHQYYTILYSRFL